MDLSKILLLLFSYYKNKMSGKTTVQKRMYFLSNFISKDFGFQHYYYGPFSNLVNQAIDYNCGLGFINEDFIFFSPELKRFDYELTKDGKEFVQHLKSNGEKDLSKELKKFYELMINCGDTGDYNLLSWAAKIHYIKKQEPSLDIEKKSDIIKKLSSYGWKLTDAEFESGKEFVKKYNRLKHK
jgi:uncharacterized protein YwgA